MTEHNYEESNPTRASLIGRVKDLGDQSGWQEFFDIYWRLIYATALKAGLNDAEAQDVVQETILTVAKAMPGFDYDPARGSFKGWLRKTTHWRIHDHLRRRALTLLRHKTGRTLRARRRSSALLIRPAWSRIQGGKQTGRRTSWKPPLKG